MKLEICIGFSAVVALGSLTVLPVIAQDGGFSGGQPRKTMDGAATALLEYPDVPHDHWAVDAVKHLSAMGVIEGHPGGRFDGDMSMTRYEWVTTQSRLFKCSFGPPPDEALRQDLKRVMDRLTALEQSVKSIEDKLNVTRAEATPLSPAPAGTSRTNTMPNMKELNDSKSDLRDITTKISFLAPRIFASQAPLVSR